MTAQRRRRPPPPIEKSEAAKWRDERDEALRRLNGDERYAEFDGVTIDLNHSKLPPALWVLQGDFGTSNYSGPVLRFPSDPEPPNLHYPLVALSEGDSVAIAGVTSEKGGSALDRQPDLERKIATLHVVELNKKEPIALRGRLVFRHPKALLVGGSSGRQTGGLSVRRVAARVATLLVEMALEPPADPDGFAEAAQDALIRHAKFVLDGDIQGASNAAAEAGYFLARAEDQVHPVVGRGVKAVSQQMDASKKGAEKRAEGKSADWIPRATSIRAEHPSYTINKVATIIADETGKDVRAIDRAIRPHKPNT
jgi:hypothetical protein